LPCYGGGGLLSQVSRDPNDLCWNRADAMLERHGRTAASVSGWSTPGPGWTCCCTDRMLGAGAGPAL